MEKCSIYIYIYALSDVFVMKKSRNYEVLSKEQILPQYSTYKPLRDLSNVIQIFHLSTECRFFQTFEGNALLIVIHIEKQKMNHCLRNKGVAHHHLNCRFKT